VKALKGQPGDDKAEPEVPLCLGYEDVIVRRIDDLLAAYSVRPACSLALHPHAAAFPNHHQGSWEAVVLPVSTELRPTLAGEISATSARYRPI
jgi:hypothetical protein